MRLPSDRMYKALVKKAMSSPFTSGGSRVSDPYFFGGVGAATTTYDSGGNPVVTLHGSMDAAGVQYEDSFWAATEGNPYDVYTPFAGRVIAVPVYFVRGGTISSVWVRQVYGGTPDTTSGGDPDHPELWTFTTFPPYLVAAWYAPISDTNPYPGAKLTDAVYGCRNNSSWVQAAATGNINMPSITVQPGDLRWIAYAFVNGTPAMSRRSLHSLCTPLGYSRANLEAGDVFGPAEGVSAPVALPAAVLHTYTGATGGRPADLDLYPGRLPAIFPVSDGTAHADLRGDQLNDEFYGTGGASGGPPYVAEFGYLFQGE